MSGEHAPVDEGEHDPVGALAATRLAVDVHVQFPHVELRSGEGTSKPGRERPGGAVAGQAMLDDVEGARIASGIDDWGLVT
jgi:hypothetical protein